jgi:hypothetical protein
LTPLRSSSMSTLRYGGWKFHPAPSRSTFANSVVFHASAGFCLGSVATFPIATGISIWPKKYSRQRIQETEYQVPLLAA